MKFKKLTFHNWIPYRDTAEIIFATSSKKNITLIRGRNQGGKSAIMRAIRWVLYDNTGDISTYQKPLDLLNNHAASSGDFNLSVSLELEKDGSEIKVTRSLKSKMEKATNASFDQTLSILKDGASISGDREKFITELLAEDISNFFLFDGEMLQQYSELTSSSNKKAKELKARIEKVIRTPFLIQAGEDLHSINSELSRKIGAQTTDDRLREAYEKLASLEEAKNNMLEQKVVIEPVFQKQKEALLAASSDINAHADSVETIQNLEIAKADLINNKKKIEDTTFSIKQSSSRAWKLARSSLLSGYKQALNARKKELDSKLENEYLQKMLQESISSNTCTFCDLPLSDEKKTAYQARLDGLKDTSELAVSNELSEINKLLHLASEDSNFNEYATQIQLYEEAQENIFRADNTIENLKNELGSIKQDDIQSLLTKQRNLEVEVGELEKSLEKIDCELNGTALDGKDLYSDQGINHSMEAMGSIISQLEEASPLESIEKQMRQLTNAMRNALEGTVTILLDEMKSSIEKHANTMNETLTKEAHNQLKINDTYGLSVIDDYGNEIADSAAGSQMIALSLLYGLKESTGLKGPLIIDTPFARVDLAYRKSILEALPQMSEQCILLVHDGEIAKGDNLEESISNKVGKWYSIEKKGKQLSEILED
ncbi:AAA family ATPase [Gammaproteobacteria bacterium]|nr:AAA family ATPase [Gammaproteobacteria bacterium]